MTENDVVIDLYYNCVKKKEDSRLLYVISNQRYLGGDC